MGACEVERVIERRLGWGRVVVVGVKDWKFYVLARWVCNKPGWKKKNNFAFL